MITKNYNINNNKIKKDIKIAILSDIHYSDTFKLKRMNQILKKLEQNNPDYICISGDIIDKTNILDKKDKREILIDFFKKIGKIAPTYMTLGNHDYLRKVKIKYKNDYNNFWSNQVKKLNENNIFLLVNETKEDKELNFISYVPPYNYYYNKEKSSSKEILIKDLKDKIKTFNISNKKTNILLFHDPVYIPDNDILKDLKDIDIVITGHMHNGMLPNILDNIFPKNRGLIAPNRKLYPDNARGIKTINIDNKEINLIISGGITKLSETSPKILHFGDYLYPPQIEYLTIKTIK